MSDPSGIVNAMTIDVEDYFHVSVFDGIVSRRDWDAMDSRVCANTERLLAMFGESGITATFFVLGCVAQRFPALVQRIAGLGHEVASHGFAHRLIYDQTLTAFREDVRRAKRLLEDAAGTAVVGYRAPSYSITPRSLWAIDVLIEEGYQYDSSIFPIRHDRYGIPVSSRQPYVIRRDAGDIVEIPGSTARFLGLNMPVGGGGYFRILPYEWTRWGIGRINRHEKRPSVFYLHPWEIDPGQPRLPAGRLGRFRHYCNLARTEDRLRQLCRDFRFGPMNVVFRDPDAFTANRKLTAALPYQW